MLMAWDGVCTRGGPSSSMRKAHRPEELTVINKTTKFIAPIALIAFLGIRAGCLAVPTPADVFTTLGSAGPSQWQVLEVGGGILTQTVDLSNPQGGIIGNVGIQSDGQIQDSSGPQITGDLYLGNSASAQFSGNYVGNRPVTGTIHLGTGATVSPNSYSYTKVSDNPQPLLDQARNDAISASALASMVPATSTLTQINLSHTTMTLMPGVYNLKDFLLDHSTLTLSGSGYFVFNIANPNNPLTAGGTFQLSSGKVLLANGATESHVLFNYLGTTDVAFSGGTGGTDESVLHGIIVALNAKVNLAPGLVVGEIISGKDISIVSGVSGANIEKPPPSVPEGSSTLALGCIAAAALLAFRSLVIGTVVLRRAPLR
jgi:Ice-binding-like